MSDLVLFSIGPVQEFIASARRSRDLWFGSWLLSEISKTVAHVIHAKGGELIFPAPDDPSTALAPDTPLNVANKILAKLPKDSPAAAELAGEIASAIKTRLDTIWDQALKQIRQQRYPIDAVAAAAQIADLIEVSWVSVPLGDYAASRKALEHLLAARKATRAFAPVGIWSQAGRPKSSLDGLRESVIDEHAYDHLTELELYRQFGVRRGERLCGVGLLKRHGRRADRTGGRVFSTSHVAAQPLLARMRPEHQPAIERYFGFLQSLGLGEQELGNVPQVHPLFRWRDTRANEWKCGDGHVLFEERLDEYITGKVQREQAKTELALLRRALNGGKDFTPLPYYALLAADGDGMGQAIEAQATQALHQSLSKQLNTFAQEVPGIIEAHQGSLVYAGGDDVLAFVPLHRVLQCARALHDQFQFNMANVRYADPTTGEARSPTLSVGIAITHHLEPLSDALELARAAERKAKELPGKNALAVTVSKRSGEDRTVVGQWKQTMSIGPLDARLLRFAELYTHEALPDGFAYELAQLHYRLQPARNPDIADKLKEPMIDAARRILERKRTDQDGRNRLDDETAARLRELLGGLALDTLANELIVARIFASALRQSQQRALGSAEAAQPEVQA